MRQAILWGVPAALAVVGAVGAARTLQQPVSAQAAPRESAAAPAVEWERAADSKLGANVLRNPRFAHKDEDWQLQVNPEAAAATMEWVEADTGLPAEAGRVARIHVTQAGAKRWHVRLLQPELPLKEGDAYVLTFWARADRERVLGARGMADSEGRPAIGLQKQFNLSSSWRQCSTRFVVQGASGGSCRLSLQLGDLPGTVELADLALQRDPAASAARAPHPLVGTWKSREAKPAESVRFTFNADGTGSMGQGVAAPGAAPREPAANPFRWHLKDEQHLRLAAKEYEWAISRSGADVKLVLKSGAATSTLFRQAGL